MSSSEKLDNCKKQIRSVLITHQRGCTLQQLNHDFCALIGCKLPAKEFGFKTDIDFLYSMPDVVKIMPRGNNYYLQGIADEKSQHIKNMVMKQKPSKSKLPPPRIEPSKRYITPPRFSEFKRTETRKPPKFFNFPHSKVEPKENWLPPTNEGQKVPLLNTPKSFSSGNNSSQPKIPPEQEVISLVQSFKQLAIDDLLVEYKRMYSKNLSLSSYGFSAIKDCVDSIPELCIFQKNNVSFVTCRSEYQKNLDIQDEYSAKPLHYGNFLFFFLSS